MSEKSAAVAVVTATGYSVGYADRNVKGYTPTTYTYETYDEAKTAAALINDARGMSPEMVSEIVLSSL
jgi:hypothetical protein